MGNYPDIYAIDKMLRNRSAFRFASLKYSLIFALGGFVMLNDMPYAMLEVYYFEKAVSSLVQGVSSANAEPVKAFIEQYNVLRNPYTYVTLSLVSLLGYGLAEWSRRSFGKKHFEDYK